MQRSRPFTTMLAAALAASMAVAQQPFILDTTFRTQILAPGEAGIDQVTSSVASVVQLPNGQLLVSGEMTFPGDAPHYQQYGVLLNADGTRDYSVPDFAGWGGFRITPWNEQYYVGGIGFVSRISNTGARDITYDIGNNNIIGALQIGDYQVLADGSVVITGLYDLFDTAHAGFQGLFNMIWITPDGMVDTLRPPRTGDGVVFVARQQPDGKFVLFSPGTVWEGEPVPNIFRVHADGSLDTTFHSPINWGQCREMTIMPDGKVLISGIMRTSASSPDTLHLIRLNPDGSFDPTFNNDLSVSDAIYAQFTQPTHSVLPDGRICIHGEFNVVDGVTRSGLVLLDANGYSSTTPLHGAGCGIFYDPFYSYWVHHVYSMTPGDDGSFYIYGSYKGYDDGTVHDTRQRFISRLYGLNVGVQEHLASKPLQPYPNPCAGSFTLELEPNTSGTVELLDASGRVAYSAPVRGTQQRISASAAPGVYTVRVRENSGTMRSARVLVVE